MSGSFSSWSDADTTSLRSLVADLAPDTATISRVTRTPDVEGGSTESWSTVATVACRVHNVRRLPDESEQAGGLALVQRWEITVPAGTDVRPADRIVVSGFTYEVQDEPNAPLSFEARTKVSVTRIS